MPVPVPFPQGPVLHNAVVKAEQTGDGYLLAPSNALVHSAPAVPPEASMQLLNTLLLFYQVPYYLN